MKGQINEAIDEIDKALDAFRDAGDDDSLGFFGSEKRRLENI